MDSIIEFIREYSYAREYILECINFLTFAAVHTTNLDQRTEIHDIKIMLMVHLRLQEETFQDVLAYITQP